LDIATTVITPIASAVLAFAGAVVGQWWTRRSAVELDHWRRREETMRMLRWGAVLAADEHPLRAEAGLRTLTGLTESELLQPEDKHLVDGIADMFLNSPLAVYTEPVTPTVVEGPTVGEGDDGGNA
jgi:hypothetical protein